MFFNKSKRGGFMKQSIKYIIVSISFLTSSSVWANSYIQCGKTADFDNFKVAGFELAVSSEDDLYEGAVGGSWDLKLGSEDEDWEQPNPKIVAKTVQNQDGTVTIVITKTVGNSPTGAVGEQYQLIDLYNDTPVLEKYNIGGFTGKLKTGTFQCISAID